MIASEPHSDSAEVFSYDKSCRVTLPQAEDMTRSVTKSVQISFHLTKFQRS